MKRLWNACGIAFSMYSAIPMPQVAWTPENMRYAFCFFPLVGAVIGGVVYGWLWLCQALEIGAVLTAAVATALPVLLSGGIHLDGFCDTVDALASHAPTARKLEILSDPHTGAFAVMGCCLYLLLTFALWHELPRQPWLSAIVSVGFALSRALSGLAVVSFRCAKTSGLAAAFANAVQQKWQVSFVLFCWIWALAFGMLRLSLVAGGTCLLAVLVVFCYYKRCANIHFGGITGDLAGYFLQLGELGMLAAAVLAGRFLE
ncbi:MAG: adenosylcobinamide-GDP ribazoletransferase [Anaerotruncus sp.]|nr:adenosylcobinamide-GDP ribazoletransferase [Anaerotruncus sp.]